MTMKVKNTLPWNYVISDLNDEEIVRTFYEKEMHKTSQTELGLKKLSREKAIDCTSNGRAMIIHSIS